MDGGRESRQMVRTAPLEVTKVVLPSGGEVTVPSEEETLPKRWSEWSTVTGVLGELAARTGKRSPIG